jgi:WD40 repeat protein
MGGKPSLAFSPDGKFLTGAGKAPTLCVWDATTGGQGWAPLNMHVTDIQGLAFSPNGKRLAGVDRGRTVRVWDVASGREVLTFRGHTAEVQSVAFSPDGQRRR